MSQAQANLPVDQKKLLKLYRQALADGISLDKVEKKANQLLERTTTAQKIEKVDDQQQLTKLKKRLPKIIRMGAYFLPIILILTGIVLVGSAVLPIVIYYFKDMPDLQSKKLASPVPQEQVLDIVPLFIAQTVGEVSADDGGYGQVLAETDKYTGPVILDTQLDYTNLSNWFEDSSLGASILSQAEDQYILEIPELNIENAVVKTASTSLSESLVQYPGTAMPGQPGAPVIFGHSVLRQFYNPKESNPRRYTSIFSTLMTLKKGDKIYIKYGNIRYTYMVQDKTEVKPTDTYILAQRYDSRRLKLVTCVPEGTYLRRGVITAVLVKE